MKVLALFPNQTEPEQWHPLVIGDSGKKIEQGICPFSTAAGSRSR